MRFPPASLVKPLTASLLLFGLPRCPIAQRPMPSAALSIAAADLPSAPEPQASSSNSSAAAQSSSAQTSSTPAQTPSPQPPAGSSDQDRHAQAQREIKQQESQRMLGIVPAFNEVIGGHAAPLTPRQKFSLFFHGSIDPYQFVIAGLDAGIEQAEDQYPEYHYGFAGYSKRYGAAFADNFDGNFWGNAVLPSLLHQDPRYFRRGHGSVIHRILYSASTTVVAHSDSGRLQPNYSNVLGNFIGGAISNAYYPAADRGFGLTIERGATVTAEGAIGSLAEEFYPDLAAWWHRRHANKASAPAPATVPQP